MEGPTTGQLEDERPNTELPGLLTRLSWVFVSPGRLVTGLVENPLWVGALLASGLIVALSAGLIPIEMILEANRAAALERGADFPEMGEGAQQFMRVFVPAVSVLSIVVFTFIFAGLYTVVFAFVLGDEGSYKQYLAVVSHAWFIPALFALLLVPLKISANDAQLTLDLGLFMPFLPDGYLQNLFRFLDLTQIWSVLVIAQGAHAIDRRRSFGSAATILLILLVLVSAVIAWFA